MLLDLVRQKVSRIDEAEGGQLRGALSAMLASKPTDLAVWQAIGKGLFSDMMARIGAEEGVPAFAEGGEPLRDRLPNHVGSLIRHVTELLVLPTVEDPEDACQTSVQLLLRLAEWMARNYENRCLFGKEEGEAATLLKTMPLAEELWGDKDEVWLALEELLDSWALGEAFRSGSLVLTCRTYGVRLEAVRSPRLLDVANWAGGAVPAVADLAIAVTSAATDQCYARAALVGRDDLGRTVHSSGRFEGALLAALAEACGSPPKDVKPRPDKVRVV